MYGLLTLDMQSFSGSINRFLSRGSTPDRTGLDMPNVFISFSCKTVTGSTFFNVTSGRYCQKNKKKNTQILSAT